jgi:hypothetical protein
MRYYPQDQGLSAFLLELKRERQRTAAPPPPIDRQVGVGAETGIPCPPEPIPPQKFSALQQENRERAMAAQAYPFLHTKKLGQP